MSWQDHAACTGRNDIDWFPTWDSTDRLEWKANLAAARAVCEGCPVRVQCFAEAMRDPNSAGIWAGTTESQRHRSPQAPRSRPRVARCGTDAGYYRHLRQTNTEPCRACLDAHAIAGRVRKHMLAVTR